MILDRVASSLSVAVLTICAFAAVAAADQWSENTSVTRSDRPELNVTQPENYQVTITINGKSTTDTVPALFKNLEAGYYALTFVAPNGAKWTHKFEAKKYQTTNIVVKHVVDAPADKAAPAVAKERLYIGSVRSQIKSCNSKAEVRIEFISGTDTAASLQLKSGNMNQASVPAGIYDVRAFVWDKDQWTYQSTTKIQINGDNWKGTAMCDKAGLEVRFDQQ